MDILKGIGTKVEDKGNRRIQGQTGKATCGDKVRSKIQHGGPIRSARRRAKDLGNGSQLEEKPPIAAAQIMNECDMCTESCQGSIATCCRGGIFLAHAGGRNGDQVGGQTRRSQPFSLGSN